MDTPERYRQRLEDFRRALTKLEDGLEQAQSELEHDGVIQRFEFTFEQGWKAARLWLLHKNIDVRNARDTLRAAMEQGLIEDGNLWSRIQEARNLTSHTYNEKTAEDVFAFVRSEGAEALNGLYNKLIETPPQ